LRVDLLRIDEGTPSLAVRIEADPVWCLEVVFHLMRVEVEQAGLSEDDFADLFGAVEARAAQTALKKELSDFFRDLGRPEMVTALERSAEAIRTTANASIVRMEAEDLEALAQKVLSAVSPIPGPQSTTLRESSASIPTP
ncbi:MAG: hypothetical protein NT069_30270, partial [Planctomycetota bacterium]|nr:hypothetical protein [Planctomycetota bacterium]